MPSGDVRTPWLHPTGPMRSIGALRFVWSVADSAARPQRHCSNRANRKAAAVSKPGTFQLLGVGEASRSIRRNALWNLAGNGLPLLSGAVAIPPLLSRLGTEQFRIVTLIWTLFGYYLFDFGLGRALSAAHGPEPRRPPSSETWACCDGRLPDLAGGRHRDRRPHGPRASARFPLARRVQTAPTRHLPRDAPSRAGGARDDRESCLRRALKGHERFKQVNMARLFLGISTFLFPALAVTIGRPR